jgi:endo-1,4-beta-xylanase
MRSRWILGTGIGILVLASALTPLAAKDLSEKQILGQADARIRKYRTGEAVIRLVNDLGRPLSDGTPITIEQTKHKFLFGANIFMLDKCATPEDNAAYAKEFSDLLNYATLPFYWWTYEPEKGKPDYQDTERIIQWCSAHGITMKGHPLAWNEGQPSWLPSDPAEARRLQMQRITDIVSRFKGQINFWDVVNEATDFDRESTRQDGPTLTAAIRTMGVKDYLHRAFARARQANPDAMLVINDYVTTRDYADKVLSQMADDAGHPLYDVIGIQCHQHRQAWTAQETWDICERFAKFDRPLHFTEATILSGQLGWELKKDRKDFNWASTPEGEAAQAREVEQFYTILFSHPAVEAITWWDFSDQGAWQGAPAGLVRADMTPKPAYEALMKLIKGKWWTHTETKVRQAGEARFRGFFGTYRVTAKDGMRILAGTFNFDQSGTGPINVRLQ